MREIAEREAAGESLWTEEIAEPVRRKIAYAWEVTLKDSVAGRSAYFYKVLDAMFKIDGHDRYADRPEVLVRIGDTDMFLTHLEAIRGALKESHYSLDIFDGAVNKAFNAHRVSFRMVEGEVIPLSSDELHVHVVEPTLRLLVDSRFDKAHAAYLKALKEISHSDPGDAITDAATALEETMKVLGCEGNSLGARIKDAVKKGLLGSHDQTLTAGLEKFMHWASADRSETGDGHKHSDAVLADAWLMVHIVGALIVRLVDPTGRGQSQD